MLLDLSGTRVTDAGLEHLTGLRNLMVIHHNDTSITPAGIERLERAQTRSRAR